MTDVLTSEQRSFCMSRIRGRDTKPERILRSLLWHKGLRFRKNYKNLPGRPDIVFIKPKVAVFIDGCFWHRCPTHYQPPAANAEFWEKKIAGNVKRDREVDKLLKTEGWNVIRVWEHEVREDPEAVAERIAGVLNKI